MATTFEEKIDRLSNLVEAKTSEVETKASCFSIPLAIGVATPFALAVVLWLIKPRFVTKKVQDKPVIDSKKLLQWTIIMTLIIWIALYLYTYCQESGTSAFCWLKGK